MCDDIVLAWDAVSCMNIEQDDFICQSTQWELDFLAHFSGCLGYLQTRTAPFHVSVYIL